MERMACPECANSEFFLTPDGEIACANDDCYARFGRWTRTEVSSCP